MSTSPTDSPTSPDAGRTLYSIQLLRFLACALVIVSHLRTEFGLAAFGSSGVDVFFVISGFIIYHVTAKDSPHFFTKRLIRIVPLYWFGTLALALVALQAPSLLNNVEFDPTRVLASLLFLPYWTPDKAYLPILMLGWSLNYELLFYFLFFVSMRISHRHRFAVCSAILAALALTHPLAEAGSAHAFWSNAYIVEFTYGMAIGFAVERTRWIANATLPIILSILVFGVYCLALFPEYGPVEAGAWRFLTIGLPSALLVIAVLSAEQTFRRLPGVLRRHIGTLGDLSFAAYIFHIYVMGLAKRVVGLDVDILIFSMVVFAGTGVVSYLMFRCVEVPCRTLLTGLAINRSPRGAHAGAPRGRLIAG